MNSTPMASINNFALVFTMLMGLFTILLPRRFAFVPLLIIACFITLGQKVIILGLNFTFLRVLIIFGWLRLILRNELHHIKLNTVDKAFLLWCAASVLMGTLLTLSLEGLVNRLGIAYNALGIYFLFRLVILDFDDIVRTLKFISILLIPLTVAMIFEQFSGRNIFFIFGGVPEFTAIRDHRLRCQGPFGHPILAGTFGATLVPLLVSQYFEPYKNKMLSILAVTSATIITVTSASTGPLMAYISGVIGLVMWPMRWKMRYVRWAIVLTLLTLHMIMKAPAWSLIGRISARSGGGGWHRSELIDTALLHLNEWWLVGTLYTKHWMLHDTLNDPNMIDITNQYLWEGVNGGLLQLSLFIMIIVVCYKVIGKTMQIKTGDLSEKKITLWCFGVALLSNLVSFISVSYFDQIIVFWYLLLAFVATVENLRTQFDAQQIDAETYQYPSDADLTTSPYP